MQVEEKVVYGLYSWMTRTFWEGDRDSDHNEQLLCVNTDPEVIRQTMNEFWTDKENYEGRRNTQMKFEADSFKTNEWYSDGGGCGARGGYTIKPLPTMVEFLISKEKK
jgi:hypothetical protein